MVDIGQTRKVFSKLRAGFINILDSNGQRILINEIPAKSVVVDIQSVTPRVFVLSVSPITSFIILILIVSFDTIHLCQH